MNRNPCWTEAGRVGPVIVIACALVSTFAAAALADGDPSMTQIRSTEWQSTEVGWLGSTDRMIGVLLETPEPRWQCFDVAQPARRIGGLPKPAMPNEVRRFQDCLRRGDAVRSTLSTEDGGTRLALASDGGEADALPIPSPPTACPRAFPYAIGMEWVDLPKIGSALPNRVRSLHLDDRFLRLDIVDGLSLCWARNTIRNVRPSHLSAFVDVIEGWVRRGERVEAMIEIGENDTGARVQRLQLYRRGDDIVDASFELMAYVEACP